MTPSNLQTIFQIATAIGLVITALGGFGAYYFGKMVEKETAAKTSYSGRLEKKNDNVKILDAKERAYPKLEFGDSGAVLVYAGPQGSPLFSFADENALTIELENSDVKVSTIIRDKTGRVVAELKKNEWKVNPNNTWDRNYSTNALEVKDPTGDIVLQVILLDDRVRFQAKLYDSSGRGISFGKVRGPEGWGGGIEITGPKHPDLLLKISPVFKYPSDLHLGEMTQ
jgi:hypothetical protein